MTNFPSFAGAFTAVITPFTADGSIDWPAYDRLLERQIAGGISGVIPCGTTGESPTLTKDEKNKLISRAVELGRGKILIMAGTGSNNTAETIEASKRACDLGADALLLVVPYYNKPSQAGLEAHFTAIADAVNKPCFLYNVPGRTVASLAPSTVGRLARHPHILGIKEASGNIALLTEMRREVMTLAPSKQFIYLSGDDPTTVPFLAAGGHGVISVASNVLPKAVSKICKDMADGRTAQALTDFETLFAFFNALFVEANPTPCKTLLSWGRLCQPHLRLPLVGLATESETKLRKAWEALPSEFRKELPL